MAVEGVAALRAKLRALPREYKAEIRVALAQSAEEVAAMARRLAPVESGALRASIGWTFGKAPKGSMVLAEGGSDEADLRVVVFAGNDRAFYARWHEFGTVKMAANPFFFPAYRSQRRRVRARITRATRKAARKVAGKA
jgi:HK97 gp10 family phage protein